MKNLVFLKETKSDLKFFPQRKSWPKNISKFLQTFKEEITPVYTNTEN